MIIGIIYFLLALGVIVLVHEAGHLIVAKRNGIFCHEFSIGMGPKLKTFGTDKSGTVYNLRAIPLGGYVILAGEETGNPADQNLAPSQKFDNKSKWIRFKVLVAGATMNFILAIILLIITTFFGGGVNMDTNQISVAPESPLAVAGIQTGDQIVNVNNSEIKEFNDIILATKDSKENQIEISYFRDNQSIQKATVKKENDLYGFAPYKEKFQVFNSIKSGFTGFYDLIKLNVLSIQMLVSGQAGITDLTGPIGIADYSVSIAKSNFTYILNWIALLSVGIGFINLMPIPALDGGRILFLLIEFIIRRPINKQVENTLNTIVFVALIGLFFFISFNDVIRIISR